MRGFPLISLSLSLLSRWSLGLMRWSAGLQGPRTTQGEGSRRGQSGREDLQISSSTIDKAEDTWIKATFFHPRLSISVSSSLLTGWFPWGEKNQNQNRTNVEAAMRAKESSASFVPSRASGLKPWLLLRSDFKWYSTYPFHLAEISEKFLEISTLDREGVVLQHVPRC